MAKDAGFFRNEKFLFRKLRKWPSSQIEEKMKAILRSPSTRSQALNEIVNEIRACTVVLLGSSHPHYCTSFERIAGKSMISTDELWEYRYHLLNMFPKLSHIADDTVRNFQRESPYSEFGNFNETRLVTAAEFCHSIYFGYTFKSHEIAKKIEKLLSCNPKSAKFYLGLDIDAAMALNNQKSHNYRSYLENNFAYLLDEAPF
jgi:hypothetical protein